jgi:hypothetical protein
MAPRTRFRPLHFSAKILSRALQLGQMADLTVTLSSFNPPAQSPRPLVMSGSAARAGLGLRRYKMIPNPPLPTLPRSGQQRAGPKSGQMAAG